MDYFSIIILVIITFIFITDRKIKTIDYLKNIDNNLIEKIEKVRDNMIILKCDFNTISKEKINDSLKNECTNYLFLQNSRLCLNEEMKDILIANFLNSKKKICGFNVKYRYIDEKKFSLKRVFVNLINYLNLNFIL